MNVLIFGLGLHGGGVGVANYFLKHGHSVRITDLKNRKELAPSIERLVKSKDLSFTLGNHSYEDIKWADLIIKNPGVPPDSPFLKEAQKLGKRIDSDIGTFIDLIQHKTRNIVGVTGTRGKSTTSTLIYEILKKRYDSVLLAGNITISVFDILDEVKQDSWVVLELSSFQLGGIKDKHFSPHFAVITNFLNDHLNYYRTLEDYFNDKSVIYRYQNPGDILIINRDNQVWDRVRPNRGVLLYSFGFKKPDGAGIFLYGKTIIFKENHRETELFNIENLKLRGRHNILNVMAASMVGVKADVDKNSIKEAIFNFKGLEHRMEYLGNINGIKVYNDSASTTPDAVNAAIESLKGESIILITGGTDKSLPLENFTRLVNNSSDVKRLILLDGSGTRRLLNLGIKRDYKIFKDLEEAVEYAVVSGNSGDVILFSPGFASFEMFKNEFDRGKKFKTLIKSKIRG